MNRGLAYELLMRIVNNDAICNQHNQIYFRVQSRTLKCNGGRINVDT